MVGLGLENWKPCAVGPTGTSDFQQKRREDGREMERENVCSSNFWGPGPTMSTPSVFHTRVA